MFRPSNARDTVSLLSPHASSSAAQGSASHATKRSTAQQKRMKKHNALPQAASLGGLNGWQGVQEVRQHALPSGWVHAATFVGGVWTDHGVLLNIIAGQLGMHLQKHGLYLRLGHGNALHLSHDPWKVFGFLGLSYAQWVKGFGREEELFSFLTSAPVFNPGLLLAVPSDRIPPLQRAEQVLQTVGASVAALVEALSPGRRRRLQATQRVQVQRMASWVRRELAAGRLPPGERPLVLLEDARVAALQHFGREEAYRRRLREIAVANEKRQQQKQQHALRRTARA